ncbi:MAG: hypothetical protein LBG70_03175 [Bifidobacteriaceae bacterium]|jgi:hypothetical protein|nr:hypothetical protein [Bifidobacteriaceae bacterium]
MSALPAPITRRDVLSQAHSRPQLQLVVAPKRRRGLIALIVICLLLPAGTIAGVLYLKNSVVNTTLELHNIDQTLRDLAKQRVEIAEDLARLNAPAALASQASELGMVPANDLGYISLADGTLVPPAEPADSTADQSVDQAIDQGGEEVSQ